MRTRTRMNKERTKIKQKVGHYETGAWMGNPEMLNVLILPVSPLSNLILGGFNGD